MNIHWLNSTPEKTFNKDLRCVVFFNHTSLYEVLFISGIPYKFLWTFTKKMVAPGADKTLNRPLVGLFWRFAFPQMLSITRKRDNTWSNFKDQIADDSIVTIAAEGRMKRPNGLDLDGNKMTVKSGIIDVIEMLDAGNMAFIFSGGLHHVQVPGQHIPHLFKNICMNIEIVDIHDYKNKFTVDGKIDARRMRDDLQLRLETKIPAQD